MALNCDTLELLQDTAKKTVAAEIKPMPNNPEKHLLISGGVSTSFDTPFVAPPRRHTVETVDSFAAAYNRWGNQGGEDLTPANIWVDINAWRLLFFTDEPLRRSWVRLKLTPSPQLLLLQSFAAAKALEQKALVRMLRHDLADCVDAGVLASFRSVDFQKITTARAAIQHDRQSLDADIVAQVTGEKKPEAFLVDAPLFAMKELADSRIRVGITIDIDCDNKKFVLQAQPGQLELAMDEARDAVLNTLENDLSAHGLKDVVILDGTPGDGS